MRLFDEYEVGNFSDFEFGLLLDLGNQSFTNFTIDQFPANVETRELGLPLLLANQISLPLSNPVNQASLSNPVTVLMPFEGSAIATQIPNGTTSHGMDYAYDFFKSPGTPGWEVLSVADGIVVSIVATQDRHETGGIYGNFVTVLHNPGTDQQFYASYLHLEPEGLYTDQYGNEWTGTGIRVSMGDLVNAGTVLGYAGSSGSSLSPINQTPAHLHIEFGASVRSVPANTSNGTVNGLFVNRDLDVGSVIFESPVTAPQTVHTSSNVGNEDDLGSSIIATTNTGFIVGQNLVGTQNNDTFLGGPGVDTYNGLGGEDTISTLDRTGTDWVIDLSSTSGYVDAVTAADPLGANRETLRNVENATLGDGDDIIILSADDNTVNGGDGIDIVRFAEDISEWVFFLPGTTEGIIGYGPNGQQDTFYGVEGFEFANQSSSWELLPEAQFCPLNNEFMAAEHHENTHADCTSTFPDLVASIVSISDTSPEAGQSITINYEVSNIGDGDAIDSLAGIYISTNSIISASDTLLATQNSSTSNSPGSTDSESQSILLPNWVVAGTTYYIGVIADYDNQETGESNESNNASTAQAITINGTTGSGDPDLIIQNATINGVVFQPGDTVTLNWDVLNQGTGDAASSRAGIYLSTNTIISTLDDRVDYNTTSSLVAGAIDTNESDSFTLDANLAPGTYYVGFIADYQGVVAESDETNNNDVYFQIAVGQTLPDYEFSFLNVSLDDYVIEEGSDTTLRYTITNTGSLDTTSAVTQGFWVSTDTVFGDSDDVYLESDGAGFLSSGEVNDQSDRLGDLADLSVGTYYIFAMADYQDEFSEGDESNNLSNYLTLTVTAPAYDFSILGVSLDETTIEEGSDTTLRYTITNTGSQDTTTAVTQGFWASTDTVFGNGDDIYLESDGAGFLSSGEVNEQSDTLGDLADLAAGTYYIFTMADFQDEFVEGNEANNVSDYVTLTITAPAYDFSILSSSLDDSVITQGSSTTLRYTVTNTGSEDTAEAVYQGFWISTDTIFGNSDDVYLESDGAGFLSSGEVNEQSDTLGGLADFDIGTYYIFTMADYQDDFLEGDETNNVSSPVQLTIAGQPDLTVSDVTLDDFTITEGGETRINFTVSNIGVADAFDVLQGIYISTDNVYDGGDVLLDIDPAGTVTAGEIDTNESRLLDELTEYTSGTYYLFVVADYDNGTAESNENNNVSNAIELVIEAPVTGPVFTEGNDNEVGTAGNDVLNALGGNDIVDGLAGDDIINGGDGADTLTGGLGADALNGDAGFDSADYRAAPEGVAFNVLTGGTLGEANGDTFSSIERYYLSNFNDTITGSSANEFFFGEDGNDTINAGGGIDRVYGGDGNDVQRGQDGNDQLYGSAGSDQLNGGTGFDISNYSLASAAVIVNMLTGGTGGDAAGDTYFGIEAVYGSDFDDSLTGNNSVNELRGGDGNDALFGLGGNDRFFGGEGTDSFDGGTGTDIVNYTLAAAGVTLDLISGGTSGEAAGDSFTSIEWVFGSDFDDDITGDAANNRLEGRDGNDTLNGGGGNDRLLGGEGNDTINGGDGVDTIFGQDGDDILSGGAGNDFFFGGAGADSHDGGTGTDTVSYLASSAGVTVNMQSFGTASAGDAAGDSFTSIERIFGSGHDDILLGNADNNTLLGNGGNDYLAGGSGNDSLNGGAGVDSFGYGEVVDGADVITGFTLNETVFIFGGTVTDFASLQALGSDAGANVIFDFGGGNTLTIVGRNLADLAASNFDFSGMPPAGEPLIDTDAFAADIIDVFDMDALI